MAAVLAFIVAGSGQAFQGVACPSHDDSHAGARHAGARPAGQATASSSGHDLHEAHGQAANAPQADRSGNEAPEGEDRDHPCTCMGVCCQSAVAESSGSKGLTSRLGFTLPLAFAINLPFLPAATQTAYVLPFSTAPPHLT